MKKFLFLLMIGLTVSGCVTAGKVKDEPVEAVKTQPVSVVETLEIPEEVGAPADLENIKVEELEDYTQQKGVIISKTDFQGLLETRYVKFLFEDQNDPKHKFQLHIGDKSGQQSFPWDVKTVNPGYFFVELPAGHYKISSVTIPVGSTTATEAMDVNVEVIPNTVCYVGTLKMVGTKEKIKLGGVPVIKPGF